MGPTAQALRALASGPKTNAELQDAIYADHGTVARIMHNQRARGNVTSTATGKGSIATYALTEEGRQAVVGKERK
jgi:DNA-binding PadR family transcriptional regulator